MLNKYELPVAKEEMERCDTLRYSWQKLISLSNEVSSHLLQIQPMFKGTLIENVKVFLQECNDFYSSYEKVWYYFK